MKIQEVGISRMFFVKLEPGDDILETLTKSVKEYSIQTGFFTAIGALQTANFAYYLLEEKQYKTIRLNGAFEILSCIGNVTQKDGAPLIHAHIVIGDDTGQTYGGHLLSGNHISVTGEVFLVETKIPLTRELDMQFDLSLIAMK